MQLYQRYELQGTQIVTTTEIDDLLAFEYDIEIRPDFDHTALINNATPLIDHPYFKTEAWTAEINFWKYSGSI